MGNEKQVAYTSIVNKYPSYRRDQVNGCWKWLRGRRADDNAEGLWRVHDKLYDLKDFISNHPGGSDWLTLTKGTDITEAFESYHIRSIAEQLLPKYFIRDASAARNYRLTFEEDGFYRTLKRRAAEKYKTLDKSSLWQSKLILDLNVLALFISSIAVMYLDGFGMKFFAALIASICAGWMNTLAHNFTHQRDNWRMYTSNLILIGWDDWRTYHGLSHHLYPNSYTDYEVSSYEHVLPWIPIVFKSKLTTLTAFVMTPFAYAFLYHIVWIQRWTGYFMEKRQKFAWQEFIPLTLPLAMFLLGNSNVSIRNLIEIILVWQGVIIGGSFLYSVVAVNAGHHGPKMIHEGDEFKSLDYGIYQLGATIDRSETKVNLFMTLTHFGDHLLHHLFPSLDHVLLPQFRDVLFKTCEDFNQTAPTDCTLLQAVVDQFKQLSRTTTIKLQ